MKTLSAYLFTAVLGLSVLSGCKKDSEDADTAPSKTSQLTAKSWRPTDIKVSGQSVFIAPFFNACDKDDFIKFNPDKSAIYDEGVLKCDATKPQTSKGSWELTTNETKLKLTDPRGDVTEGTIVTLNSTTLILNASVDILGTGTPTPVELSFTAQ